MEAYKKSIKRRIGLLTIPVCIAALLGTYDVFGASEAMKNSFIFCFQCGGASALGLFCIILIFRYRFLLDNEEKLKLEYIKETDERLAAIRAKAGMPLLLILSIGMIIAGIIAGYFNIFIFYTLIITAVCQMIVGCCIKLICMKTM